MLAPAVLLRTLSQQLIQPNALIFKDEWCRTEADQEQEQEKLARMVEKQPTVAADNTDQMNALVEALRMQNQQFDIAALNQVATNTREEATYHEDLQDALKITTQEEIIRTEQQTTEFNINIAGGEEDSPVAADIEMRDEDEDEAVVELKIDGNFQDDEDDEPDSVHQQQEQ